MNVTVADCLRLPTLREAQLVAGAKGWIVRYPLSVCWSGRKQIYYLTS